MFASKYVVLLSLVFVVLPAFANSVSGVNALGNAAPPGDVNLDGVVNLADGISILKMILSDEYNDSADINCDGVVSFNDVIAFVNSAGGNLSGFHVQYSCYTMNISREVKYSKTNAHVVVDGATVNAGESAYINITATDCVDLTNFDIAIIYNPSILSIDVENLTVNSAFKKTVTPFVFWNESEGWVRVLTFNVNSGVNGDVPLVKLRIVPKNPGIAMVGVKVNTLLNSSESIINATVTNGSVEITNNQKPVAAFSNFPINVFAGQSVTFNASESYDPDGQIVDYTWDFGDGNTANGVVVQHVYAIPGKYTVTLTVTDNSGLSNSTSKEITVSQQPERYVSINTPAKVSVNDVFTVVVRVDSITEMVGYDLIINYDTSLMQYLGYELPSPVSDFPVQFEKTSNGSVEVGILTFSPTNSISGEDVELLELQFKALNTGNAAIWFNSSSKLYIYNSSSGKVVQAEDVGFLDSMVSITATNAMPGDLNGDGKITFDDLICLLNLLLSGQYDPAGDMNGDNKITFDDLIALLNEILSGS